MTQRIAILGAGVMGETLLSAILASGHPVDQVVISEKRADRAAELRAAHGVDVADNAEAVAGADIVLLVVKPQDVPALLDEIAGSVSPAATVVSLAAGIRTDTMRAALPDGVAVVRAMPNTPALVGEGMFGVSPGPGVTDQQLAAVVSLLESGGRVAVVDESLQDAVTAVSGSGPAYVFYLAEAMIAGGVAQGLDLDTARTLAAQTLVGAAKLLSESPDTAEELRRRVTSPNGTTHAAITTFDDRGVKDGLVAGVVAAAARSAELSGPA
ncbi:pyrroline-5-carboxylate reductase [Aeromicrobium fastidiosum]|uniref:Pyrroline-5-carboxylate reductase n=1 Tax=Aeromicrobium fastidiosum TaxID=52699 RepID=A0A641AKB2_9ACTN|nr:pyrroline-5-carboxylate reductase [Aeromicrobium fastidiosum]KAA1374865.1 pyrroline-5-carboxylate reductase [Aeromicrobium fastidiosum]MBP2390571.1 pyrroline-5-carboxylate reductase [Aeromicrobium fastidiosum]